MNPMMPARLDPEDPDPVLPALLFLAAIFAVLATVGGL